MSVWRPVARKVASEEVGPGLMGRAEKAVVTIKLLVRTARSMISAEFISNVRSRKK